MSTDSNGRPDRSHDPVRHVWETNAEWWDAYYEEGNDFHLTLIAPATERLLQIAPDETILDIACGNGAFSRRMAALGARVVAFDFSRPFIECARKRTTEGADRIEYRVMDAADEREMLSLGEGRFDAAVCTMALMDMETIEPLAKTLPNLLKAAGRFIFSIMHPCFHQMGARMLLEEETCDGRLVITPAIKVTKYMTPFRAEGIGIRGQPVPQTYFHRPLQDLLRPFFESGLVIDGLEERAFAGRRTESPKLSWDTFDEIPPALVVRLRKA
jgi:2-polyprenyl-3-methyl-5-hydroxy-6-metoxy-1,4-benzoquinol methylase